MYVQYRAEGLVTLAPELFLAGLTKRSSSLIKAKRDESLVWGTRKAELILNSPPKFAMNVVRGQRQAHRLTVNSSCYRTAYMIKG